jgi:large subunit ribosomal protein L17
MRHRKPGNRLSRPADQRKAVLRALATELLRHNEIITTVAKAKALRPEVEKIITTGKDAHVEDYQSMLKKSKQGDEDAKKQVARTVHLRRQVGAFIYDRSVVKKVFNEIAPRYKDRHGGYTRILKAGVRRGDATPMAIIQLV